MLDQARASLGGSRTEFLVADLASPLPEGPWDVIVPALAAHHLDDAGKQSLFARAFAVLAPGGVFVNAEQVSRPMPALGAAYGSWHERRARQAGSTALEWDGAVERMAYDRCGASMPSARG